MSCQTGRLRAVRAESVSHHQRRPFTAALLAAGLGSRLGGRPKAALQIDGHSILARLTTALREAGSADVSVVIGPYRNALRPLAVACGAHVVEHVHPDSSLIDSQRLALADHVARHAGADLLLVVADLPLLSATHITPLLQAWSRRPDDVDAMMPVVGGVRGHPVLLSWAAVRQIAVTPAHLGIRDWLASHPTAIRPLPVDEAAYITDIDTPADVDRLRAFVHPASVAWPEPGSSGR